MLVPNAVILAPGKVTPPLLPSSSAATDKDLNGAITFLAQLRLSERERSELVVEVARNIPGVASSSHNSSPLIFASSSSVSLSRMRAFMGEGAGLLP